jgi:transcriptional regulator with XRE-family HTH domain
MEVNNMVITIDWLLPMNFPARLIQIRKANGLTQQALADNSQLHITQIRRYEAGTAQPTLEGLIKLAKTLHVSIDELVFNEDERKPSDGFALQFEAINELPESEQMVVREVLDSLIIKYQSRRWDSGRKQVTN